MTAPATPPPSGSSQHPPGATKEEPRPWPMKWTVVAIVIFIFAYNLYLWLGT
ncbi:MAG: hypothetical protein ABSH19_07470 [Opitutales bacterium]